MKRFVQIGSPSSSRSRIQLIFFSLGILCGCLQAEENQTSTKIDSYTSVTQVLADSKKHLDKTLMVQGYLSTKCAGICLFAYKDDALISNVPNSIQLIVDGLTIAKIESSCVNNYVTLIADLEFVEGFPKPGFVNIAEIRKFNPNQVPTSEVCFGTDVM